MGMGWGRDILWGWVGMGLVSTTVSVLILYATVALSHSGIMLGVILSGGIVFASRHLDNAVHDVQLTARRRCMLVNTGEYVTHWTVSRYR